VKCWGANAKGRLGLGLSDTDVLFLGGALAGLFILSARVFLTLPLLLLTFPEHHHYSALTKSSPLLHRHGGQSSCSGSRVK